MSATILGIESSCDETAAAICKDGKIINNIVATQAVHEEYGGVVPELASRAHQLNIVPVINETLTSSGLKIKDIDAIAYTQGPGLLGALLVGASFAKSLALALDKPIIPVNHMRAHIIAHFIEESHPNFPFICLTVSGGHTQLVLVKDHFNMKIIGQTIDDAVGEAFDKCAKIMGVGYPGGPMIDKLSETGDELRFSFAKSRVPDFNYSFSGIKTSFMYFLRDNMKTNKEFIKENKSDLAASLQKTLVDMLMHNLIKAAEHYGIKEIAIAGGVSANSGLRKRLNTEGELRKWTVHVPKFEYCTDNAAMVATCGFYQYVAGQVGSLRDSPLPRMSL